MRYVYLFLYCLTALTMPIQTTRACSMPETYVQYVEGLPDGYVTHTDNSNIESSYLDIQFGRGQWQYIRDHYSFVAPDIAENDWVVPVTIESMLHEDTGNFRAIQIFALSYVQSISVDQYLAIHQQGQPHPYPYYEIHKPENTSVRINQLATFRLTDRTVPFVTTRLNLSTHSASSFGPVRLFAAFVPIGKQPVLIVKPKVPVKIARCGGTIPIYIRGKLPDGMTPADYYL